MEYRCCQMVNFEKENSKIKKLIGLFLVCVLVLLYALFIYQVDEQESSNRDFLIVVSFFLACICQYFVVKSMRKLIAYKGITDDDKSMSTNDELSSPKTSTSDFKEEFGNNLEDYDDFYGDDDEEDDITEDIKAKEDNVKDD